MARRKKATTKQCAMTGMTFPTSEFYANRTSNDGLHAYSKKADNFRRRLQATGGKESRPARNRGCSLT